MVLPTLLQELSARAYEELIEKQPSIRHWPSQHLNSLRTVLGISRFVLDALMHDENLCQEFPVMLERSSRHENYRDSLFQQLKSCQDEEAGYALLRHFRYREMVYIAWRDILSDWPLTDSLAHLTALAEAMIFETYQWQYRLCCAQYGTPCNANGEPQPMLIIGMGKLGGGELNFSSDIDLIFCYPENGETTGVRRPLANSQFFIRLGQRIIRSLEQKTVDGFCYRVDMRLRPFGDSGPLAISFAAIEDYYQEQGRDWERYAMVKARVMGREMYAHYQQLRNMLRPFVYRRYTDFSVIQSLRRMKVMIQREVRRRGLVNNIKLGAGGIREIEFIIQVFQLIRGGREPSLRHRGLLKTLESIEQLDLLSSSDIAILRDAYHYLRRLENLMQALADKQTQTLPADRLDQLKLVTAMGEDSWETLLTNVNTHMAKVNTIFADLIGDAPGEPDDDGDVYHDIWDMAHQQHVLVAIFEKECEFDYPYEEVARAIQNFKTDIDRKTLGPRGREVLNHLMPKLLRTILTHKDARFGIPRVLYLLDKIVTRTTYLELLDEHPAALTQLVHLCTASPMISERLARYPILLDELIDPTHLYNPVKLDAYRIELRDFLARIPKDDMEQQMEGLRQFKQVCILKVAAADIAGVLPIMKVSDHLTYLAEAIVGAVVHLAWGQMMEKYGQPNHLSQRDGNGFAVIGYGKVGGWELGYHSDLDVVFIHDCPDNVYTDGPKSIDGRQFYLRLAQRIIHLFSTRTSSGILYEIDTRLRPSGASGLLVTSVESFADYQQNEAWTWEHQALVRARAIYGDADIKQKFKQIRQSILCTVRDEQKLRQDVVDMRDKMRTHLAGKKPGRFMLKADRGGITDIEFLAQYLVLKCSPQLSSLTTWSDNVRIFESLVNEGVMNKDDAEKLINAYTSMRNQMHRRNLLNLSADVAENKLLEERENVESMWHKWLG